MHHHTIQQQSSILLTSTKTMEGVCFTITPLPSRSKAAAATTTIPILKSARQWRMCTTPRPTENNQHQHPHQPASTAKARRQPTDWATRSKNRQQRRVPEALTEDRLIARITGCTRRHNWYSAHVAFTQYAQRGVSPTPKLIGAYVHALSKGGRLDTARAVLHAHAPDADTPIARASLVGAVARHEGADCALRELQGMPPRLWSVHACTAVIHALGLEGRGMEGANLLRYTRDSIGIDADGEMYDAAMRSLGREGKVNDAYAMLSEMRRYRVKASDVTLESLMYACAHAQEREHGVESLGRRACVVYDAAESGGLLTPRVLSAFATVMLRSGLWEDERVTKLVGRMERVVQTVHDEDGLRRDGVKMELFQRKLDRLCDLRAKVKEIGARKKFRQKGKQKVKRLDVAKLNGNQSWSR